MLKKIICVYQDCFLCGSKKNWGNKQLADANANHWYIAKVSFASPEGHGYIAEAIKQGVGTLPFFTDNEGHFATTVSGLKELQKAEAKAKRATKKNKCARKAVEKDSEDGATE